VGPAVVNRTVEMSQSQSTQAGVLVSRTATSGSTTVTQNDSNVVDKSSGVVRKSSRIRKPVRRLIDEMD